MNYSPLRLEDSRQQYSTASMRMKMGASTENASASSFTVSRAGTKFPMASGRRFALTEVGMPTVITGECRKMIFVLNIAIDNGSSFDQNKVASTR